MVSTGGRAFARSFTALFSLLAPPGCSGSGDEGVVRFVFADEEFVIFGLYAPGRVPIWVRADSPWLLRPRGRGAAELT